MARAVMRLFADVQLAFGPTTGDGFYYDFAMPHKLTEEDFPTIEAEMAKIIKQDEAFERLVEPRDKALAVVPDLKQEFKVEHIQTGLGRSSDRVVLSPRGVHRSLPRPARSQRRRDRRVQAACRSPAPTGRATPSRSSCSGSTAPRGSRKEDLDAHLQQIEEAKRRDHRVLGKQLDLFSINPLVGGGLILWHPRGAIIRGELETFVKHELQKRGYDPVYTPNIGKVDLYKIPGTIRTTPTRSSRRSR